MSNNPTKRPSARPTWLNNPHKQTQEDIDNVANHQRQRSRDAFGDHNLNSIPQTTHSPINPPQAQTPTSGLARHTIRMSFGDNSGAVSKTSAQDHHNNDHNDNGDEGFNQSDSTNHSAFAQQGLLSDTNSLYPSMTDSSQRNGDSFNHNHPFLATIQQHTLHNANNNSSTTDITECSPSFLNFPFSIPLPTIDEGLNISSDGTLTPKSEYQRLLLKIKELEKKDQVATIQARASQVVNQRLAMNLNLTHRLLKHHKIPFEHQKDLFSDKTIFPLEEKKSDSELFDNYDFQYELYTKPTQIPHQPLDPSATLTTDQTTEQLGSASGANISTTAGPHSFPFISNQFSSNSFGILCPVTPAVSIPSSSSQQSSDNVIKENTLTTTAMTPTASSTTTTTTTTTMSNTTAPPGQIGQQQIGLVHAQQQLLLSTGSELGQLREQLESTSTRLKDAEEKLAKSQVDAAYKGQQLTSQRATMDSMEKLVKETREEVSELREFYDFHHDEVLSLQNQIKGHDDEVNGLKEKMISLEKDLNEKKKMITNYEKDLKKTKKPGDNFSTSISFHQDLSEFAEFIDNNLTLMNNVRPKTARRGSTHQNSSNSQNDQEEITLSDIKQALIQRDKLIQQYKTTNQQLTVQLFDQNGTKGQNMSTSAKNQSSNNHNDNEQTHFSALKDGYDSTHKRLKRAIVSMRSQLISLREKVKQTKPTSEKLNKKKSKKPTVDDDNDDDTNIDIEINLHSDIEIDNDDEEQNQMDEEEEEKEEEEDEDDEDDDEDIEEEDLDTPIDLSHIDLIFHLSAFDDSDDEGDDSTTEAEKDSDDEEEEDEDEEDEDDEEEDDDEDDESTSQTSNSVPHIIYDDEGDIVHNLKMDWDQTVGTFIKFLSSQYKISEQHILLFPTPNEQKSNLNKSLKSTYIYENIINTIKNARIEYKNYINALNRRSRREKRGLQNKTPIERVFLPKSPHILITLPSSYRLLNSSVYNANTNNNVNVPMFIEIPQLGGEVTLGVMVKWNEVYSITFPTDHSFFSAAERLRDLDKFSDTLGSFKYHRIGTADVERTDLLADAYNIFYDDHFIMDKNNQQFLSSSSTTTTKLSTKGTGVNQQYDYNLNFSPTSGLFQKSIIAPFMLIPDAPPAKHGMPMFYITGGPLGKEKKQLGFNFRKNSIGDVKYYYAGLTSTVFGSYQIKFNKKLLENDKSLSECGITNGAVLEFIPMTDEDMKNNKNNSHSTKSSPIKNNKNKNAPGAKSMNMKRINSPRRLTTSRNTMNDDSDSDSD